MYKIMIVEDDKVIEEKAGNYLRKWGYDVVAAGNLEDVISDFVKEKPQLVLMDIGLPFYNGYFWCAEIRKISDVPIVFLSSASDNMNIVMAMNMGGDDFIAKPFELEVLAAKLAAILRRTYTVQPKLNVLEHKGAVLNLADMSLSFQGKQLELSKNEFRLLQILFQNSGNVVSRENLMKKLWDSECFIDDNTLTVNVNRLRKSLEREGIFNLIITKKGIGYQLGEPDGEKK